MKRPNLEQAEITRLYLTTGNNVLKINSSRIIERLKKLERMNFSKQESHVGRLDDGMMIELRSRMISDISHGTNKTFFDGFRHIREIIPYLVL